LWHLSHLFLVLFSLLFVPRSVSYNVSFTCFPHSFHFFLASDMMTSHTSLRCFSYLFVCFWYSLIYFSNVSHLLLPDLLLSSCISFVASCTSLIYFSNFVWLILVSLSIGFHTPFSWFWHFPAVSLSSLSYFSHLFQFVFLSPFVIFHILNVPSRICFSCFCASSSCL
jgi:hypothetical protein